MTDVRSIQDRIVDPDPYVEEVLRSVDARVNHTIYGPDGKTPLLEPIVDDRTLTYSKDGQSFSLKVEETLMRAARMQRDGKSLAHIRAELDLIPGKVSDTLLENALAMGRLLLDSAIADGSEPEESQRVIGYKAPDSVAEADEVENEEGTEEALELGRKVVEGWKADLE